MRSGTTSLIHRTYFYLTIFRAMTQDNKRSSAYKDGFFIAIKVLILQSWRVTGFAESVPEINKSRLFSS
jgi:hypothetical protein